MTAIINCPDCATAMTEGFLLERQHLNQSATLWVEGDGKTGSFWDGGVKTTGQNVYRVKALRCPDCGYVKFYTTEKIYI